MNVQSEYVLKRAANSYDMAAEYGASTANPIAEEVSPTSSPKPTPAVTVEEQRDEDAKRVENQEALQYWGSLVKPDKWGSDKLNRLLTGIAHYIVSLFTGGAYGTTAGIDTHSRITSKARKTVPTSHPRNSPHSTELLVETTTFSSLIRTLPRLPSYTNHSAVYIQFSRRMRRMVMLCLQYPL